MLQHLLLLLLLLLLLEVCQQQLLHRVQGQQQPQARLLLQSKQAGAKRATVSQRRT
jgi:type III secretory pathway lipoprotein EscJ